MGKTEDEQALDVVPVSPEPSVENADRRYPPCRSIGRLVNLRCVAALLFGVAVLLSGIFWLPPFVQRGSSAGGFNRDPQYGANVVASFRLQKPVTLLNANVAKLQYDIFNEIGVPNTTVAVIYMDSVGVNKTNVVFEVRPYPKTSNISTGMSILKSSFVSLVLRQSTLHLTTPLFGSTYYFQVLEFPGGITIVPPQNAFLLQQVHMLFNFTLNFPIYEVEDKVDELKGQMKLGLLLKSYEVLFVKLTNTKGSTVTSPTVVETSIVLAVGNNQQPSVPRLKQLAQTIRNSTAGNLGLNNTVFGRVKQIRLSSFLQHSISSGVGSSSSPAPSPQPDVIARCHHHTNYHHRGHGSYPHTAPTPSPTNPLIFLHSPSPTCCQHKFSSDPKTKPGIAPFVAPVAAAHTSPSPLPKKASPAPSPYFHRKSQIPPTIFTHANPHPGYTHHNIPNKRAPYISPSSSSYVVSLPNTLWPLLLLVHQMAQFQQ